MNKTEKEVKILELPPTKPTKKEPGQSSVVPDVAIGVIKGIDDDGYPLVHWDGCLSNQPVKALSQITVAGHDTGRDCTLAFVNGDLSQPVVMGILYSPDTENDAPVIIRSDDAIILKSGASRIELHADGMINIQGVHINSHAYGPNKVKGTSVKVN